VFSEDILENAHFLLTCGGSWESWKLSCARPSCVLTSNHWASLTCDGLSIHTLLI
jgi:hypothetical protein